MLVALLVMFALTSTSSSSKSVAPKKACTKTWKQRLDEELAAQLQRGEYPDLEMAAGWADVRTIREGCTLPDDRWCPGWEDNGRYTGDTRTPHIRSVQTMICTYGHPGDMPMEHPMLPGNGDPGISPWETLAKGAATLAGGL